MSNSLPRERSVAVDRALELVLPVLERLGVAIEAENQELVRRQRIDYQANSRRKNQGLLELTRLGNALASVRGHPAAAAALADLNAKLETNHRLLGTQLRAAKTVSDIVARTIREGQSDGTYSAHPWRNE